MQSSRVKILGNQLGWLCLSAAPGSHRVPNSRGHCDNDFGAQWAPLDLILFTLLVILSLTSVARLWQSSAVAVILHRGLLLVVRVRLEVVVQVLVWGRLLLVVCRRGRL